MLVISSINRPFPIYETLYYGVMWRVACRVGRLPVVWGGEEIPKSKNTYKRPLYRYIIIYNTYDNIPTQSRAHDRFFLRAYVLCPRVCVRSNQSTRRIHQSGKCTRYLYNNKYMRTCACLNTNSDRIPIRLIKMHVNGEDDDDDDYDDGFCGHEIFPSSSAPSLPGQRNSFARAYLKLFTRIACESMHF